MVVLLGGFLYGVLKYKNYNTYQEGEDIRKDNLVACLFHYVDSLLYARYRNAAFVGYSFWFARVHVLVYVRIRHVLYASLAISDV